MSRTLAAVAASILIALPVMAAAPAQKAPEKAPSAAENQAFLAANAKKSGVKTLPSIQYKVLASGHGPQVERGDCVTVNYKGTFINGKVFDETKPGKPATFPAMMLIPGWSIVLQQMHTGDHWLVTIPAEMAYGHEGAGEGAVPPDQTLIFDMELLNTAPMLANGSCRQ